MLQVFKYVKRPNILCSMCDKNVEYDVRLQSSIGSFVPLGLCEDCLRELKKDFENFEIPDKIKL